MKHATAHGTMSLHFTWCPVSSSSVVVVVHDSTCEAKTDSGGRVLDSALSLFGRDEQNL